MTGFEETHGWHLTTKKHKSGGIFFKRPKVQTVKRQEEEKMCCDSGGKDEGRCGH